MYTHGPWPMARAINGKWGDKTSSDTKGIEKKGKRTTGGRGPTLEAHNRTGIERKGKARKGKRKVGGQGSGGSMLEARKLQARREKERNRKGNGKWVGGCGANGKREDRVQGGPRSRFEKTGRARK